MIAFARLQGQTYDFFTIAGYVGFGSVDGTNSGARFYRPVAVTIDTSSNIFVADSGNNTIRKLTPSGTNWIATTLAGLPGSEGDVDGTNGQARFCDSQGIAVDGSGNLYVSDQDAVIRKLTPVGTNWMVTTIAGSAGNFGIVDGTNNAAEFNQPEGVAVDSDGNVYVADSAAIRKLTPVGTNWIVTTIAGSFPNNGSADGTNASAQFESPAGLCVDKSGNLYVADEPAATIRKIMPEGTNWVVTTIAGSAGNFGSADGTNGNARFDVPFGLALDNSNNLYVTESFDSTIREVSPDSTGTNWSVVTIAGAAQSLGSTDGTNGAALFFNPLGVAVNGNGGVYVADTGNSTIRNLTWVGTNWVTTTIAGYAGYGSADGTNSTAQFLGPSDVAVDTDGSIYVADSGNDTVRRIQRSGTNWVVSTIAGLAGNPGSADGIGSEARFRHGSVNYFVQGLALDANHNLFMADSGNDEIRELTQVGNNWSVTTIAGTTNSGSADGTNQAAGFYNPTGIVADGAGNLYVADEGNSTIRKIIHTGTNWVVTTIAGLAGNLGGQDGTNSNARFVWPFGIALGKNGELYVAATDIRTLTPDATGTNWVVNTIGFSQTIPQYQFSGSTIGITADQAGNIYFAESGVSNLIELSPAGTNWLVSSIEGGFTGGWGGMTIDGIGNLYVVDDNEGVIKLGIPLPVLQMNGPQNGALSFTWNSVSNITYQLQYTTNLLSANWLNLGDSITATNSILCESNSIGTDSQRFYRVVRQP